MSKPVRKWECKVCGYVHVGDEPPEICPVCGAPASEFIELLIEPEKKASESKDRNSIPDTSTVSDLMIQTMVNWGITHVFGMVGHSNLGIADSIRRQCKKGNLTFIGIRHEGAASFAASAFGKLTGRPAACLSIAGPGATNMITGLWDARMDRIPILALTGQIDTQVLGPGAFQEIDLISAFASVSTWSQTVLPSSNHQELMNLALKHAILKRDVGHLIFPNEVQSLPVKSERNPGSPEGRIPSLQITPSIQAVDRAMALLNKAKRPAVIVGHGARFCMDSIVQLARKLSCPVITTFKGKGLIPDNDPLACGVLGRSGTLISAHFMNNADLLIVFGASFSQHTGINSKIPTIQIDLDPLVLGKFHAVTIPIYGEIDITARIFSERLAKNGPWINCTEEIEKKWAEWRLEKRKRMETRKGRGLNSAEIFHKLSTVIPPNAVIAVDVGNNTYSFGRYFECKRQSILMSGYLGSIGFGYPAAIGAWAAAPQRPIFIISGDGGFGQYMGELLTAVKYKMNITHILLNNSELGKISREQETLHLPVWETDLHNPDFAKFADVCGAKGWKVDDVDDIENSVQDALSYKGPSLIEILSDPALI